MKRNAEIGLNTKSLEISHPGADSPGWLIDVAG
jgi:hypothetical protein